MPVWLTALLGLLPKVVQIVQQLFEKYGEFVKGYIVGTTRQKTKDELAKLHHEADETTRTSKRLEEIDRERMDKVSDSESDNSLYRVRRPDKPRGW